MSGVTDNAVGAILDIPQSALNKIDQAEKAIKRLAETSSNAAKQVSKDWGTTAITGLDTFIAKLASAREQMSQFGNVNVNLNTARVKGQMDTAVSTVHDGAVTISSELQKAATVGWDKLSKVSLKDFDITNYGKNMAEVMSQLEVLKNQLRNKTFEGEPNQNLANEIRQIEEYIRLYKQAKEEKDKALKQVQAKEDKTILDEQKRQLKEILDLQKQVNAKVVTATSGRITGSETHAQDIKDLRELVARLNEAKKVYAEFLNTKGAELSKDGQDKARINALNQENALLKEQMSQRERLNAAIARGNELTASTQANKTRLGSGSEAIAQRQLNTDYKEMLKIIREQGELKAKVAAEGRNFNQQEISLIATLAQRYRTYYEDVQRIASAYSNMASAAERAFQNDKSAELQRNAVLLATAKEKAAAAAQKEADIMEKQQLQAAQTLVAEYKRLFAEREKLSQSLTKLHIASGDSFTNYLRDPAIIRVYEARNAVEQRMAEIERQNIQAINDFRAQKQVEESQRTISLFIQVEAQKTAAAKQAAAEQSQARIQAYQKYMNTYEGAMRAYDKIGSRDGGKYADTYENRARVIKQLENALKSLSTTDADYTNKVNRLRSALAALGVKQKEVNDIIRQQPQASAAEAKRLLTIAQTTRSLNDLQAAYNAIKAAMANMSAGSRAFKQMQKDAQNVKAQIDRIRTAMGELRNQTSNTSNMMSALQSRIAAAFSIAGIMNFTKRVVDVRAQFELQRVALGAIIQDVDKANQIFAQVQQMALESPFTIMGLEKATKQIAAFGFETEKLVPTMKMFADIAAGLGAPIDRLVLVMGHLKARNFLEGTMVRQFTNMGFNVLGELAEYYTELEGKMISVGEVQERVKKKMVSFEDVEEVLKRVTSAGGMFYDMQRKQSDSIWGQMQRIEDAWDLMLNDIGRSNEGLIKWGLNAVRSLIIHWRDLKPYIVAAIAAMGTYMAVATGYKVIVNILNGIKLAYLRITKGTKAATAAQRKLNITMMSNPYAAIAGAIAGIVTLIGQWIFADDELTEGIERVKQEGLETMGNLIVQYRQLADTIKDVTTPFEKYKEAMADLQRVYKDILPERMLELDYIKQTTDGYQEAIAAIKAYSAEKMKENMRNEVENLLGDDISEAIIDSANKVTIALKSFKGSPLKGENIDVLKGAVSNIIRMMIEEFKNGENEWYDFAAEFSERIGTAFDVEINEEMLYDGLKDVTDILDEITDKFGEINSLGIDGDIYSMDAQPIVKGFNDMTKALNAYKNSLRDIYELQQKQGKMSRDEYAESFNRIRESLDKAKYELSQYGIKSFTKDNEQSIESMAQLTRWFEELDQRLIDTQKNADSLVEKIGALMGLSYKVNDKVIYTGPTIGNKDDDDYNPFLDNWIEKFYEGIENKKLTSSAQKVMDIMEDVSQKYNQPLQIFDRLKVESKTTFASMGHDVKTLIEENKKSIKSIETTKLELMALGDTAADALRIAEEQHGAGLTLEELQSRLEAYIALANAMGVAIDEKNKDTGRHEDVQLKKWQDIKKAIEDASKAYEKYRQSFTEDEANQKIEELYGKAFKELGVDIRQFYEYGQYGADGLKSALEHLLAMINATTKERKNFRSELQRDISDTEIEIEIKLKEGEEKKLKDDIDKLFANYELTKELKSIGLNIDLTYMVGGRPMTLDGIRKELARLRDEATNNGVTEASENKLKELENAEKKLTEIQNKEQLQRIKNYKKYLTVMYSDNAQKMIESYTTMSQMEKDFQGYLQKLRDEYNNSDTTAERKAELDNLISILENQAKEATLGIQRELEQTMAKADWERFKGSDIFNSMYQDVSSLTKGAIDELITKLEAMRDTLKSVENIDPKAVREVTQYIEKLKNARIELAPFESFKNGINALKEIRAEYGSLEAAQKKLVELNNTANIYEQQISDLETLIELQNRKEQLENDGTENTTRLIALMAEYKGNYQEALAKSREMLVTTKEDADVLRKKLVAVAAIESSYNAQINRAKAWQEQIQSLTDSVFTLMDAFGLDVDDGWKQLANAIINAIIQSVTLSLQLEMLKAQALELEVAFNAALGVVGWIALGVSALVGVVSALFAIHDNRLQKQIESLQDEVDTLSEAYERLEKAMERAFNNANYQNSFVSAERNIANQKRLYLEMIRLEEEKKKTDDDKIKEYRDKLQALEDAERELYEERHERYGSTNDAWSEANNWVDAWLDAYKETGDGLDALNDSWDEFYENLVKKQAASRVLGQRMDKYIKEINDAIDKNFGDEYSYIDLFKNIGERMKAEFDSVNADLMKIFEYAGIGANGELLLSDLQQGIQSITEPQAAAIEAYLNSMRFAVHRHTEQLDTLIAAVQAQYGTGENNPTITELRGIRGVLDNIYTTLKSVVSNKTFGGSSLRITG